VRQIRHVLDSDNTLDITRKYEQRMAALIGRGYGIGFAAGRMAFFTLIKTLDIGPGDEVILPGFTCSVMPNAVWRTGATPVFADIDIETFGSDAGGIKKRITPRTKLVVAQHSFGIPCDIEEIIELCKKHSIPVVEDCALTLDSSIGGTRVGNFGDAAIFSTDHSKPLNTILGGFLYTNNRSLYEKAKEISTDLPHLDRVHQERLFNQFLYERKNYMPECYPRSNFMKTVQAVAGKFGLKNHTFLEEDYRRNTHANPSYPYPARMPPFLAQLGLFELDRWPEEKNRRKCLLSEYLGIMKRSGLNKYLPKAYDDQEKEIVPLRFVFRYPGSEKLMKRMARFIDVNWTWFREPIVCCPDGPESLGYSSGCCLIAEKAGRDIINWPCAVPDNWDSRVIEIFRNIMEYAD
jgi:dTDP-4-amino-4,6-dideoxygalactose transaminase